MWQLSQMFLETDVRDALPLIQAPTLVLHRELDRVVNVRAARWLAQQIPDSRLIEFEGPDHFPWVGDSDAPLAAIEEFLTGARPGPTPDRVLATVVFTDIVESTPRAAELGDRRWRQLLEEHGRLVGEGLERFGGREIKSTGDGFLATFDGPTRALEFSRSVRADMLELGIQIRAGIHTGEVELIGRRRGRDRGAHRGAHLRRRRRGNDPRVSHGPRPHGRLGHRPRPRRRPHAEGRAGNLGALQGRRRAAVGVLGGPVRRPAGPATAQTEMVIGKVATQIAVPTKIT